MAALSKQPQLWQCYLYLLSFQHSQNSIYALKEVRLRGGFTTLQYFFTLNLEILNGRTDNSQRDCKILCSHYFTYYFLQINFTCSAKMNSIRVLTSKTQEYQLTAFCRYRVNQNYWYKKTFLRNQKMFKSILLYICQLFHIKKLKSII